MPQPDNQSCLNCRFIKPDERANYTKLGGYCRRFPPQVVVSFMRDGFGDNTPLVEQHYPWQDVTDWCGEWQHAS